MILVVKSLAKTGDPLAPGTIESVEHSTVLLLIEAELICLP